ncbi:MAG: orotate phosphoribosyltransferase-like protein [Methanobrevibacter arboriphilus]|jgi:orotate phosphoribosyltransferase|uniref:Transcriptional regulator GfcR n=2 Tax=Methanobrevibacter arboriphilus TaxID=39441 RepID=A0A843AB92_METAZ|nr:orotate phosphoribosyltransferase-like protein [Methanobrevibacter arboriphilus]MBF4468647.1 orotate phosphoribosyltransferase-like protein [Methanobrevibacter arboriphilus]MCC7561381.1 orotate phosphoribosyltransferase-like protein [Methanobrevibacter arboriphilus]BBL62802.1 orotate phosphoribosyltransferase [Methanobrevibacter arboriphilus]GLI12044.1 orotate phosphoribosyltransferase [Methanobrevibacter arboriphilus]
MKQDLVKKSHELRRRGFTVGEIADELNVSMDTARWLSMQKLDEKEKPEDTPIDFAINWNSLGGSSSRLRYVSAALSDMTLNYGQADVIVGIAVSGIPFATMMADFLEIEEGFETSLSVFHPIKHRKDKDKDQEGAISQNFAQVKGKKVIIVDDVITSGRTVKEVINALIAQGAEPIAVTVLIDKVGISEIEGVPVESLIKVNRLG